MTSWSTPCEVVPLPGHESESIFATFQRIGGRRRKLRIQMMIRRVSRVRGEQRKSGSRSPDRLAIGCEDSHQFLGRHDFKLSKGTVARSLVAAPSAKLRHMPEPGPLHVLIGDLD